MRNKRPRHLFLGRAVGVAALALCWSALGGCAQDRDLYAGDEGGQEEEGREVSCGDGEDDDGDGATDCADADCDEAPGCVAPPVEVCDDGQDNDGDGATDCDDGACAGGPGCGEVDPCDRVICEAPPGLRCEGAVAVRYGRGACVDGECVYEAALEDCAALGQVCREGACVAPPDPCEGVVCEAPPAAGCDGLTAISYEGRGECVGGACVYEATREDCAASGQVCEAGACAAAPAEVCGDGEDNDGDGAADCEDEDCAQEPLCVADPCEGVVCEAPPAAGCDGLMAISYEGLGACVSGECVYEAAGEDCAASGQVCQEGSCVAAAPEVCDDLIDNDEDGGADCEDADCAQVPACEPVPRCARACEALVACPAVEAACEPEVREEIATACDMLCAENGFLREFITDLGEQGCEEGGAGFVDFLQGLQACVPSAICAAPVPVSPPLSVGELSRAQPNAARGSCGGDAGGEEVWIATFAADGTVCVEVEAAFEVALYVREGDCEGGQELGCNDQGEARVQFDAAQGAPYYVFVDSVGEGAQGAYTLRTRLGPCDEAPAPEVCGDGMDNDQDGAVDCGDGDCVGSPACGACASPNVFTREGRFEGSTAGALEGRAFWILRFDGLDEELPFCVHTEGSAFDTLLAVHEESCEDEVIASNDNVPGASWSRVEFIAQPRVEYLVEISGVGGAEGEYALWLSVGACDGSQARAEVCGDRLDNDRDGATDCADQECQQEEACAGQVRCRQDCDVVVACLEPGEFCTQEELDVFVAACRDQLCGEPDQRALLRELAAGTCEASAPVLVSALQGAGLCQVGVEQCGDGRDNDDDGLADCEDEDCAQSPRCLPRGVCEEPLVVSDFINSGDTADTNHNHHTASCGAQTSGNDDVWQIIAPLNATLCVDTVGSDFDTVLSVRESGCAEGREIACNDDRSPGERGSQVEFEVLAGNPYFVIVDGRGPLDQGDYQLNLRLGPCGAPPEPERCGDEVDNDLDGATDCEDEDCLQEPACFGGSCADTIPITQPGALSGDTSAAGAEAAASCSAGSARAPEEVWSFQLPIGLNVPLCLDTLGSAFDTVLSVRADDCAGGAEVACNDNISPDQRGSRVQLDAVGGVLYFVFVDGANGDQRGAYVLNTTLGACPVEGP